MAKLNQAIEIAERVKAQLAPHCDRIEIAGSIRRRKAEVGDIEIVAIPKPYDVGLFASGIAPIVSAWPKVRGELPCKYTQRLLPEGIALDLFFATPQNWGYIYAIRTGSAEYVKYRLALGWSLRGFRGRDGLLYNSQGEEVDIREEEQVFEAAGVPWTAPENRNRIHAYVELPATADKIRLAYPCQVCSGTGWYGDNGPGILGNSEFVRCECGTIEKCGIGFHAYVVIGGVPWCRCCNLEADLEICRINHVIPGDTGITLKT